MRIIRHDNLMKPEQMTLNVSPLIIWLDRKTELRIGYGDRCGHVARFVAKEWRLDDVEAIRLVTYWFAIGMRVQHSFGATWDKVEIRPDRNRRYLVNDRRA